MVDSAASVDAATFGWHKARQKEEVAEMRLSDADVLRGILLEIYEEKEKRRDQAGRSAISDAIIRLGAVPEVNAIPVEWLRDKLLDMPNADEALSKAAWMVMRAWKKEQEAR